MQRYAAAPEDARRIITPAAGVTELREAEEALKSMQTELTSALRQKERLAQLGSAVSKISHDLRNILTSAQLFTDRIEMSEDPLVARLAPKLGELHFPCCASMRKHAGFWQSRRAKPDIVCRCARANRCGCD